MRRTNYPPAVSLPPTLARTIDSKLQGLQSSAHFPESTHELKTELNNYEAKLGAGDLHISDKALMHHLGQQGTTDIKSTIFSGPLSQGKHLDRAYFIFSLAPPSKLQPDDNHDLACFSSISPPRQDPDLRTAPNPITILLRPRNCKDVESTHIQQRRTIDRRHQQHQGRS